MAATMMIDLGSQADGQAATLLVAITLGNSNADREQTGNPEG